MNEISGVLESSIVVCVWVYQKVRNIHSSCFCTLCLSFWRGEHRCCCECSLKWEPLWSTSSHSHTHTHTHTHIHTRTKRRRTHAHTHTYTHTHKHTHAHTHALLAANVGTLNVHMQGVCGLLLLWVPPEKLLSTHMHTHTHKHTQKHTHALLAAYFGTPACVLCPCAGCVWSTAALGAAREAIVERPMHTHMHFLLLMLVL